MNFDHHYTNLFNTNSKAIAGDIVTNGQNTPKIANLLSIGIKCIINPNGDILDLAWAKS